MSVMYPIKSSLSYADKWLSFCCVQISRQVLGNHDYGETNGEIPTNCPPGVPCFYSPIHEVLADWYQSFSRPRMLATQRVAQPYGGVGSH